jgi:hypothetical protein
MGSLPKESRATVWIDEVGVAAGVVDLSTVAFVIEWRKGKHPGILAALKELPPAIEGKLTYLGAADGSLRILPEAMLATMHKLPFADGSTYYERAVSDPEEWLDPAIPALVRAQEYAEDILRADIEDFDAYSVSVRATWIIQTMKRVNNVAAAIQDLGEYVARARPGGSRNIPPIEDSVRDVRAAILNDVHQLSSIQIGERLGIPAEPVRMKAKRENQNANSAVARGREVLHRAFGEEGWRASVERMRALIP